MATKAANDNLENEQTLTLNERRQVFGINLRAKREEAGISIISLSQSTRISVPFISALEAGDFEKLPGYIFGRGFVRNICKITETDEKYLLQEFSECWEGDKPLADIVTTRKSENHKWDEVKSSIGSVKFKSFNLPKIPSISLRERAIIGSVVATLVTVGLIFIATKNLPNSKSITAKLPTTSGNDSPLAKKNRDLDAKPVVDSSAGKVVPSVNNTVADGAIAVNSVSKETSQEHEVDTQVAEDTSATGESDVSDLKTSLTRQNIEILVKDAVKIRMQIDQQNNKTIELKPDTYNYSFDEVARLLIFDAGAIEIKFNGKEIGNLGRKGRIRRISFSADSPEI